MKEIIKDIEGYEGEYKISNFGYVLSYKHTKTFRILSNKRLDRNGYPKITLSKNGEQKDFKLHQLVNNSFNEKKDKIRNTINHIDGNKLNNCSWNLEIASRREQLIHAYKLNLKKPARGTENTNSKFSKEEVLEIRRIYKKGCKINGGSSLGKRFGVSESSIRNVVNFRTYINV